MQYILLSLRDTWAVEQLQDDITRRADRHQQFEYVKSWDKNVDCGGTGTGVSVFLQSQRQTICGDEMMEWFWSSRF